MTRAPIIWVPFSARTRREFEALAGSYAFVGSEIVGCVFTLRGSESWYGTFAEARIGSCRDEAQARANVEHRWANGGMQA
jgi:hypothetical protein